MDGLERSVLAEDLDRSGDARLVTLASARTSTFSTRVLAETRSFRDQPVRERVLLKLPVGRSPPRGAILEARVRVIEPSPEQNGFDERAWLAHQGIHVVLRASDWRQVGRRGGILGLGDRLRERVERAVSRGTSGLRRGVVLGVVLGEDEDLSAGAPERLPRVRPLPSPRRLGSEHRVPRRGRVRAVLAPAAAESGQRGARRSRRRRVRARRRLAAVGDQSRRRRRAGLARLGGGAAAGSLALPRARSARPRGVDADLRARSRLPALVRRGRGDLRRRAARCGWCSTDIPCPSGLADALAVSCVCGLVTAPILLLDFGQAPLYTVAANLLAFAAAPLVLGLGLLAALADPVSHSAAAGLAALAGWAAAWLELVARAVAGLPAARIGTRPTALVALGAGGLWLALRMRAPASRGPSSSRPRPRLRRRRDGRSLGRRPARAGLGPTRRAASDVPRRRAGRLDAARDSERPRAGRRRPSRGEGRATAHGHGHPLAVGDRPDPPAARPRRRRRRRDPADPRRRGARPGARSLGAGEPGCARRRTRASRARPGPAVRG